MHDKALFTAGKSLDEASKALIMIHGRGGSAGDILSLASHLNVEDYTLLAPQATNNTWYPYSFMAKTEQNEPWLSSALDLLEDLLKDIIGQGITTENIYFLGFSQGACLTLEFVARNAAKFGGVVALTGGLIGKEIQEENYKGSFEETPFFISTGNPDLHIPLKRMEKSVEILKEMGAKVAKKVYNGRPHTITQDEMDKVNELIFRH